MEQSSVAEPFLARQDNGRNVLFRPIIDAVIAFALLCFVSLALGIGPTSASPHIPQTAFSHALGAAPAAQKAIASAGDRPDVFEIATTKSANSANAVYGRTSFQAAWFLLMLSVSAMVALNLALLRHMRKAYAPKKRRNSAK